LPGYVAASLTSPEISRDVALIGLEDSFFAKSAQFHGNVAVVLFGVQGYFRQMEHG
jgi:hypothetical protein